MLTWLLSVRKKEWFLSEGAQAPVAAVMGAVSSLGVGLATDIIDFRRSSTHPEKGEKPRDTSPIKAISKHNSESPSSEKIAASAAATDAPPPALRNAGTFKKYKKYGRTRRLVANVATHLGRSKHRFPTYSTRTQVWKESLRHSPHETFRFLSCDCRCVECHTDQIIQHPLHFSTTSPTASTTRPSSS